MEEKPTFCAQYHREQEEEKSPEHYNNEGGSLYDFSQRNELNTWEFDCIKRLIRCRKKGKFVEDLDKTIFLINLYKEEYLKLHPELK